MKPKVFYFKDHLMYLSDSEPQEAHRHLASHLIFSLNDTVQWEIEQETACSRGIYIQSDRTHHLIPPISSPRSNLNGTGNYLVFLFTSTSRYAYALKEKFTPQNADYATLEDELSITVQNLFFRHPDNPELFDQLVMEQLNLSSDLQPSYDERITEAIRFIENAESIDPDMLQILSRNACLSESRFSHLFKEQTQMTLNRFLSYEKLRKTFHLILSGKNITESCMLAGFASPSHCATTSKKLFGISLKKPEFVTIPPHANEPSLQYRKPKGFQA